MKDMAATADNLARIFRNEGVMGDWDALRDEIDTRTGGDLDCFQLDMLTDLVVARMSRELV